MTRLRRNPTFDRSLIIDVKLVTVSDMSDTPMVLLRELPSQKRWWVFFDKSARWHRGDRIAERHAATAMRFSRRLTAIALRGLERLLIIISTTVRLSSVRGPRLTYTIETRLGGAIEQLIQLLLRLRHKGDRLEVNHADAASPDCSATARHTLELRRAIARYRESRRSWRLKPTLWTSLAVLADTVAWAPNFGRRHHCENSTMRA